jgi:diguanylate cyclase (GGDEF)-like protein/PAS domain S-box-containing protein
MIRYANLWYNSRRYGDGPRGSAIPIGSRMLAIADAFDSMTTDTVYRPAMSRERAIQELMKGAETQFDPELACDFSRMLEERPEMLHQMVIDRWLRQLQPSGSASMWGSTLAGSATGTDASARLSAKSVSESGFSESFRRETLFYQQLTGDLKDGVIFTDAEGTITLWNVGMQRLTSIAADAIVGQTWSNESLRLRESDSTRDINDCLVRECLSSGSGLTRSMLIEQPGRPPTPVQLHVTPVTGAVPGVHGAVVIVRDLSDQATMEEKLENLHQQTTRDPLTGVANRAHFDNVLADLTDDAAGGTKSFSLIMCDIDHFKQVNDVHGHPAGDEALKVFASVLVKHSRDGDTVARYGGEEFLLITPNCDNATATKRAEAIRVALETTPLPSLGNESVTASFGVTEFQAGDSAETILARSDRALLKAKDNGRNRVIQFGAGNKMQSPADQAVLSKGWLSWFTGSGPQVASEFDIVTPVPVDLAIEKLRGFIADHHAEIISVDENQLSLKLNAFYSRGGRRRADQQMQIRVKLTLSEARGESEPRRSGKRTNVHVHLQPIRNRDRRGEEVQACFSQVLSSLRSYLMGELKASELA